MRLSASLPKKKEDLAATGVSSTTLVGYTQVHRVIAEPPKKRCVTSIDPSNRVCVESFGEIHKFKFDRNDDITNGPLTILHGYISADPRRWQGERVRGAPRRYGGPAACPLATCRALVWKFSSGFRKQR